MLMAATSFRNFQSAFFMFTDIAKADVWNDLIVDLAAAAARDPPLCAAMSLSAMLCASTDQPLDAKTIHRFVTTCPV